MSKTTADHARHVTLWCTCSPSDDDICEYRKLADRIIDLLNPADDDVAEVAVVMTAVERITEYVVNLPCKCTAGMVEDYDPCPRCAVLGRIGDEAMQR